MVEDIAEDAHLERIVQPKIMALAIPAYVALCQSKISSATFPTLQAALTMPINGANLGAISDSAMMMASP